MKNKFCFRFARIRKTDPPPVRGITIKNKNKNKTLPKYFCHFPLVYVFGIPVLFGSYSGGGTGEEGKKKVFQNLI